MSIHIHKKNSFKHKTKCEKHFFDQNNDQFEFFNGIFICLDLVDLDFCFA